MGQPVKLSDELVMEARIAGEASVRSIAGQVEYWANLGRAMDRIMNGTQAANVRHKSSAMSLSESIENVNTPLGRQRLQSYLDSRPFPRFVADPIEARVFIREDADGTRTRGRFVKREFVPIEQLAATR